MKPAPRIAYSWLVYAAAAGFIAGMVVMAALFTIYPVAPASAPVSMSAPAPAPAPRVETTAAKTSPAAFAPPVVNPQTAEATPTVVTVPTMGVDPIAELRGRHLELPVTGAQPQDIHDMFEDRRGGAGSRRHEAIDVMAVRHAPVVAVEDGTIARLFLSDAGGITIYQFDPSSTFCYYYAHLQRYADGLKEGDRVKRGDVIGYVGTTGNAPPDAPHLHFAIFQLTDKKQWWQGTPIDPYKVLR